MKRSVGIGIFAGLAVAGLVAAGGMSVFDPRSAAAEEVTVYRSPTCGCCGDWVKHMRANGFRVVVKETDDLDPVKRHYQVPGSLASCHTAVVEGYVIEGHVPAVDVQRLLASRPKARGLAVPGMPAGSPGMETGGPPDRYSVILFGDDGSQSVFSRH
jgi:hypothetical protein